jgi:hypothetical protein
VIGFDDQVDVIALDRVLDEPEPPGLLAAAERPLDLPNHGASPPDFSSDREHG